MVNYPIGVKQMSKQPIVEFKNVSFKYGEDKPWVLKNVSFTINRGEWVAIIGHNGSGKSTIAKLTNGLLFPTEGEIYINGIQVTDESIWEVRKDIGLVFQNPDNQFVGTTVRDDIAFGMENRGIERNEMLKRIERTLEIVGMTEYEETEPHRLSGGQKQRVAIASVLAIEPKVLILDEATSMLDPKGRKEILETVADIQGKSDLSLITITHDLNEIVEAKKVIVMNKGEIWTETTPKELFRKGDELYKIGLDVPFVTNLTKHLREIGVSITEEPLYEEELLEQLISIQTENLIEKQTP